MPKYLIIEQVNFEHGIVENLKKININENWRKICI